MQAVEKKCLRLFKVCNRLVKTENEDMKTELNISLTDERANYITNRTLNYTKSMTRKESKDLHFTKYKHI